MQVIIKPSVLKGTMEAINSKSVAHRALMMAAVANEPTTLYLNEFSKDILVTMDNLKRLGIGMDIAGTRVTVTPSVHKKKSAALDLMESGSTLRFMTAFATVLCEQTLFQGADRLTERPIRELIEQLQNNGLSFSNEKLPFTVTGTMKTHHFQFSGDVSSQYISAALMAGAARRSETIIQLKTPLESKAYVDITIDVMKKFGVQVIETKDGYIVKPSEIISPKTFVVEGDWSNSAFFLVAGALQHEVEVRNLDVHSVQGDREIMDILRDFGAEVTHTAVRKHKMRALHKDISQIPDLVPILAVLLCNQEEKSYLTNGRRLRMKESDRLISTQAMIRNLGGSAEIIGDDLCVWGKLQGGRVDSFNDHRIVMAAAIASVKAKKEIVIDGAEAVNKSYPSFFEDFETLGGIYVRKEN